jgi:hypothetical protein
MRQLVRASSAGALALASSVVLTLGGAGGASAVEVTGANDGAATLLSTVDGAGQQAAQDYWTPERMAAAQPADRVVEQGDAAPASTAADAPDTTIGLSGATRSTLAAGDAPRIARDTRGVADVVTGAAVSVGTPWPGSADAVKKVGRLYFAQGAGNYECTASSVASPAGDVIVTAGHCLTESGVASTNVVFVPGLKGTSEPYGRFPATRLFTTTQWKDEDQTSAAALNYDVGFAVVAPVAGKSLADTVGTFDIDFTTALDRVTVFGYPGRSAKSDGNTLQYCTGTRFTDVASNADATTDRATLCNMAGGSSGGPWLTGFDPATGAGTVTSVVSFSYNKTPAVLYGPLFGDVVEAVYHEAAGV